MQKDDLERRLNNWALWYWGGGWAKGGGGVISSVYSQGARGRRAEVPMPVIDGEAIETNAVVDALARDLRDALRARYLSVGVRGGSLRGLSGREIARRLGCSEDAFERRLITAKHMLPGQIAARRRRFENTRTTPLADTIMAPDTVRKKQ